MSIFSHIQAKKPRHNTFDLSHDRKMSMEMGRLVPIFCAETVPGDTFRMSTSQMLRFAPMIAPVMHRVTVYTHFFFVPNRLIWPNWEDFITGGDNGTAAPAFPYVSFNQPIPTGRIADYLGFPTEVSNVGQVSALPFAAYGKIYNDYYRDQNLIDPVWDECRDGSQQTGSLDITNALPFKRAWQHDYFTSALPWTQKGPQATIPLLDGDLPVTTALQGNVGDRELLRTQRLRTLPTGNTNPGPQTSDTGFWVNPSGNLAQRNAGGTTGGDTYFDPGDSLIVSSDSATAASINDLRNAFRLQEWLEKNARGGSRYIEQIKSHFGVNSSDSRLQRPEFLGGGSTPVSISEVLQTSDASANDTPQGNMAGHGISVGKNHSFKYFCEEHGQIIGIMSVMPKTAYQDGIPKQFLKFDKFDYFWPSFANLGEQPILNKELYVDGELPANSTNEEAFGYTPRYSEYKYMNDSVHGEFRSTLSYWHMGRKFIDRPTLNRNFIESSPTNRIFAVTESEKLYVHIFHKIRAKRPMPYYGTPTI